MSKIRTDNFDAVANFVRTQNLPQRHQCENPWAHLLFTQIWGRQSHLSRFRDQVLPMARSHIRPLTTQGRKGQHWQCSIWRCRLAERTQMADFVHFAFSPAWERSGATSPPASRAVEIEHAHWLTVRTSLQTDRSDTAGSVRSAARAARRAARSSPWQRSPAPPWATAAPAAAPTPPRRRPPPTAPSTQTVLNAIPAPPAGAVVSTSVLQVSFLGL